MNEELIVMDIIVSAGEAKGYLYEALSKAKEGKFEEVDALFEKAEEALGRAHDIQTSLITREANGEKLNVSILFVHSQDHLMTCMSEKNLIREIIEMRRERQA
ncbi:PTS lactose/cellobiose transporter subunit IIA [Clostridium chromiireducens]|uniref:PTS lactose/cellobiose transporter subunit IIA n=1 Tax=Clostridium chromiireducens TaxID=225345 RepID=A0A964W2A1_9CLOT|nr:PTS lactose/cellobiose transporter subunit IIA [Clostridium chromiireducens]MVX64015.1 PTS lactose/cellobiose transporter subunit IIA [Clostridium chromiireducens]